jgi:hypothetical protein
VVCALARGKFETIRGIILFMAHPIKTCVVCGEEFELRPGKPGFANRCPSCSEEDSADAGAKADGWKGDKGANAARREAMRNLLYRKDS